MSAALSWLVQARLPSLFERDRRATEKQCPECLSDIPVAARRCAFCTARLDPVPAEERPPA
ncbi:hypothetical protein Misp01_41710 [Microtetraspora sp. NBRC 13810]|uniref:hypothetical protein n=1 Tax=Microtetraspora sp. NBRC 13810 TaxID=3030990 RepID=UPI0025569E10|nr:hypothetical protein [Microtetraspora sp. NBRC 13810]GLW09042.1 hypothetical protein Misp01_41710 [Microtetraspora sp. NBRC 13810]